MLKKMLEWLDEHSRKAAAPVDLNDELGLTDPRRHHLAIGGQLHTIDDTPALRTHAIESIDDLIAMANRFQTEADPGQAEDYKGPSVWHSTHVVTCLLNDADRLDMARVSLALGAQFSALIQHDKGDPIDQPRFVRFLRFALGLADPIVAPFRRLAWTSNTSGAVIHGSSSMGKSIEAKSNGTDQLPERLTLEIPAYNTPGANTIHVIRCGVDVDVDNQRLKLVPEPDAIDQAIDAAQSLLRKYLRAGLAETIPLYRGTP